MSARGTHSRKFTPSLSPTVDHMRLLVLTGFFGSGKTTFLLRALRLATREAGLRTVIVQNEIGRVGVDPEVFRRDGLIVKELLGGCICCSLSTRLVSVLDTIVSEKSADLVCIEASGIATPGMVRSMLAGTDLSSLPLLQVNVLDAARLGRIEKMLDIPVVRQGVEASDLCVINKIDAVADGFRESFEERVRKIRPDARVYFTNLSASESLPDSLADPLRDFFRGIPLAASQFSDHPHHHDHYGDPAVCALEFLPPTPARIFGEAIRSAFDALIHGIEAAGGLIGHVKVALIGAEGSRHFLNSTGIGRPDASLLPDDVSTARVVINAIAWRIDRSVLESLTRQFLCIFHD